MTLATFAMTLSGLALIFFLKPDVFYVAAPKASGTKAPGEDAIGSIPAPSPGLSAIDATLRCKDYTPPVRDIGPKTLAMCPALGNFLCESRDEEAKITRGNSSLLMRESAYRLVVNLKNGKKCLFEGITEKDGMVVHDVDQNFNYSAVEIDPSKKFVLIQNQHWENVDFSLLTLQTGVITRRDGVERAKWSPDSSYFATVLANEEPDEGGVDSYVPPGFVSIWSCLNGNAPCHEIWRKEFAGYSAVWKDGTHVLFNVSLESDWQKAKVDKNKVSMNCECKAEVCSCPEPVAASSSVVSAIVSPVASPLAVLPSPSPSPIRKSVTITVSEPRGDDEEAIYCIHESIIGFDGVVSPFRKGEVVKITGKKSLSPLLVTPDAEGHFSIIAQCKDFIKKGVNEITIDALEGGKVVGTTLVGIVSNDFSQASETIDYKKGGKVEVIDKTQSLFGASIEVWPTQMDRDLPVKIRTGDVMQMPSMLSGYITVGPAVTFEPHGMSFKTPATLTVPFDLQVTRDDLGLPAIKANTPEGEDEQRKQAKASDVLVLGTSDKGGEYTWAEMPVLRHSKNTVSFQATHLARQYIAVIKQHLPKD